MGKSSHKSSKERRHEEVEDEEFTIPKWVTLFIARITKVYAKEIVERFLRMKINTVESDIQKLLEELAPLSDGEREKRFQEMLEESKPSRSKKPKTPRDPKAPKKNQTAYLLWSATIKNPDIERDYPDYAERIKKKELTPAGARGEIWKSISEDVKNEFLERAEKDKERYFTEMEKFDPKFVRPAPSRAASRAPSRASSPERPAKSSKKKPAPRDKSPKRKPAKKEEAPAKKSKKEEPPREKSPPKKKAAASKRKLTSSSSSSSSSSGSYDQSEGPSQWAE